MVCLTDSLMDYAECGLTASHPLPVSIPNALFGSEHETALIAFRPGRAVQRGHLLIYERLIAFSHGIVELGSAYLILREGFGRDTGGRRWDKTHDRRVRLAA